MDINGAIDINTVIVGDFNTPRVSINRSSRQKINKEKIALNDTPDQLDLIHSFTTFHPKAAEYTFFSSGKFSRIDHMLGHKTSLNKFKKTEIVLSISNHKGMKLEMNHRKNSEKHKRHRS